MAALPGGDLDCARAAARRASVLAQTPEEAGAAAELLALIEHETGHHAAELRYARSLVELQPRRSRAWMVLQRAERCVASRCLGADRRGAPAPAADSAMKQLPVSSL